jgi:hypothetical protein
VLQPAPAPRFDRTPADAPHASTASTPDEVRQRWQTAT